MTKPKASVDMIHRSLDAFEPECVCEEALRDKAREAGFEGEHFHVGDEVVSVCGSMAGYILSIEGGDALISWSCRGKSVEHMCDLTHVEHHAA